jgi:hypothetical protein
MDGISLNIIIQIDWEGKMKINKKMHIRRKGPGAGKIRNNPGWKQLGKGLKVRQKGNISEVMMKGMKKPLRIQVITERIKGGKADGLPDQLFKKKDLRTGMKVESEHTTNKAMQKEITKDHIVETGTIRNGKYNSRYYPELKKLEKKLDDEYCNNPFCLKPGCKNQKHG